MYFKLRLSMFSLLVLTPLLSYGMDYIKIPCLKIFSKKQIVQQIFDHSYIKEKISEEKKGSFAQVFLTDNKVVRILEKRKDISPEKETQNLLHLKENLIKGKIKVPKNLDIVIPESCFKVEDMYGRDKLWVQIFPKIKGETSFDDIISLPYKWDSGSEKSKKKLENIATSLGKLHENNMEKRGDQLYSFVHFDLHLNNIMIKTNNDLAYIDNGGALYKGREDKDQLEGLDLGGSPEVDLFYFTSGCLAWGTKQNSFNANSAKSFLEAFYTCYLKELSQPHATMLVNNFQSQNFDDHILQNVKKNAGIIDLNIQYSLYLRLRNSIIWNIQKEAILSGYKKIYLTQLKK